MLNFRIWIESLENNVAQIVSQNPNLKSRDITRLLWKQGHNVSSFTVSQIMKQLKLKPELKPKSEPKFLTMPQIKQLFANPAAQKSSELPKGSPLYANKDLVDKIINIYKSNPNLSDKEIAKIIEPNNYSKRY